MVVAGVDAALRPPDFFLAGGGATTTVSSITMGIVSVSNCINIKTMSQGIEYTFVTLFLCSDIDVNRTTVNSYNTGPLH